MHYNLEMLEHNSKNLRKETNEEDPNSIVVEKCAKFCEKINDQIKLSNEQITTDEDSACPKEVEQETREEMIFRTMRYLLKERKETKVIFRFGFFLLRFFISQSIKFFLEFLYTFRRTYKLRKSRISRIEFSKKQISIKLF